MARRKRTERTWWCSCGKSMTLFTSRNVPPMCECGKIMRAEKPRGKSGRGGEGAATVKDSTGGEGPRSP